MLIRKNSKNIFQQQYVYKLGDELKEQKLIRSKIYQDSIDYSVINPIVLGQTIKQQQNQIKKLIHIIDSYKKKIKQFQHYEQVIKKFLAHKQMQKQQIEVQNKQKHDNQQQLHELIRLKKEVLIKSKKQNIVPNYCITIFCQQQKQHNTNQKFQFSRKKEQAQLFDIKHKKIDSKSNKQNLIKTRQKSFEQSLLRQNRNSLNQSYLSTNQNWVNHILPQKFPQQQSKSIYIQRVPSLDNLRRIQKCMKLLKS